MDEQLKRALTQIKQDFLNGTISQALALQLLQRFGDEAKQRIGEKVDALSTEFEAVAHVAPPAYADQFRRDLRYMRAMIRPEQ